MKVTQFLQMHSFIGVQNAFTPGNDDINKHNACNQTQVVITALNSKSKHFLKHSFRGGISAATSLKRFMDLYFYFFVKFCFGGFLCTINRRSKCSKYKLL